jgi:hypothetical protein
VEGARRQPNEKFDWIDNRVNSFLADDGKIREKVGVVGSRSRTGRALQGAGSFVTPGDLSNVRSPVRSRVFEALTPGGGRGIRKPRARMKEREWRCPEGFQFGGRFTDSKWSTCGRQLFDLPSLSPSLLQIARGFRQPAGIEGATPSGRVLRGQEASADLIKVRAAQIPRVGPMSKKAREDGINASIKDLSSNADISMMMVRRDGFPMQPVVNFAELRGVPDNRNMEDAGILLRPASIDDIGKDELGLLSNTGVTSLVYVFPNGSTIRMDRARPLSVGERRKLGKTVSSASEIDNSKNPLARLNSVVNESDGAITLNADFSAVKNADDLIETGDDKGKPRWSVEAFKGDLKPGKPSADAEAPKEQAETKITNIENAIEHINNGGNLSEIDSSILMDAVKRSKIYKQKKLNANQTLFDREDGVSFVEVRPSALFEGLGAHLSSDLQVALDVLAPKTRLVGKGDKRAYLVQTPESLVPGSGIQETAKISDMEADDLLGLLVSDYLSDVRRRSPATITGLETDDGIRAVARTNAPSALAGLSAQELERRRDLDLNGYMDSDGSVISKNLRERAEEVRQQIIEVYDDLIQRARGFRWDNYMQRLTSDGELSPAEVRHMEIVKSVFDQRLENLTQSREMFAEFLGITNE